MPAVEVTIPTRNRPDKLERCLGALDRARAEFPFRAVVCDSSNDPNLAKRVRTVCRRHDFAALVRHERVGVSAARNVGAHAATAPLLVVVDDDVYVEPEAIRRLASAYQEGRGWRVVAGTVAWGDTWSHPAVMRAIGYARPLAEGEQPSFLVGAFFLYPRALALALPWNERIRTSDDRFMGALWRSKGVKMLFAADARATHDEESTTYSVEHQRYHIYANLFDALIANPSVRRALSYEFLGFAAGAKRYFRSRHEAASFIRAWASGHGALVRDWAYLVDLVDSRLPE